MAVPIVRYVTDYAKAVGVDLQVRRYKAEQPEPGSVQGHLQHRDSVFLASDVPPGGCDINAPG